MKKKKYFFCISLAFLTTIGIVMGSFSLVFSILSSTIDTEDINSPKLSKITYEFTGESDHFSFDVGKVYVSNNDKVILMDIFKQKKKIKGLKSIKVETLLDDKKWLKKEKKKSLNKIDKRITEITFYEIEEACYSDKCKHTIFNEIRNGEKFKESFKMQVTYCLKNGKCKTEKFKIKYKEE